MKASSEKSPVGCATKERDEPVPTTPIEERKVIPAKHVGIIQSLIVTCRLHGIDPYTYLVNVLQRIGEHPASRVAELTPRLWKERFAANPLRSDIEDFTPR